MLLSDHLGTVEIEETDSANGLMEMARKNSFDLAILDVHLKDTNSITVLHLLRSLYPNMKILFFTMLPEEMYGKRLMAMGAHGFLSKKSSNAEIIVAVRALLAGDLFMSRNLKDLLAQAALSKAPESQFECLSDREFEVMLMLLDGKNAKDISNELGLQITTVGTYKTRLFEKLGINSIIELSKLASANNLL